MRIEKVDPRSDYTLTITTTDGTVGQFDVKPYLRYEAFEPLKAPEEFVKIRNGGYFVEWQCGADLSSDTIEATMTQCCPVS